MMGVSTNEVEQVLEDAKINLRIAGFEEEERRMKQRSSYGPVSLKLPQGPYIFSEFRTLELPGVKVHFVVLNINYRIFFNLKMTR